MNHHDQTDLIDRSPLGLFAGTPMNAGTDPAQAIAETVRRIWQTTQKNQPVVLCLYCKRKPAAAGSCCCSHACKTKLSGSLNAWAARLKAVELEGQTAFC